LQQHVAVLQLRLDAIPAVVSDATKVVVVALADTRSQQMQTGHDSNTVGVVTQDTVSVRLAMKDAVTTVVDRGVLDVQGLDKPRHQAVVAVKVKPRLLPTPAIGESAALR
jgi:xanthine dehydrogenase molybdopterin-binding subunit B